jgi:hypothetical protein
VRLAGLKSLEVERRELLVNPRRLGTSGASGSGQFRRGAALMEVLIDRHRVTPFLARPTMPLLPARLHHMRYRAGFAV